VGAIGGLQNGVSDRVAGGGIEWGEHTEMKTRDTRRLSPRRPILEEKSGNEETSETGRQKVDGFYMHNLTKPRKARTGQDQEDWSAVQEENRGGAAAAG